MKKRISLFLMAALLSQFTACAQQVNSETDDTTYQDNESQSISTSNEKTSNLPTDFDCEGYNFKILKQSQDKIAWSLNTFGVTEDNGEVLNDTFAKRNREVTEKYNFTIEETEIESTPINTIRQMVLADDDEYDAALIAFHTEKSANDGTYYNLYDLPYLDLTQDCWNQSLIRDLTSNGELYFLSGDIIVSDDDGLMINIYNKPLGEDYKFENLYDVVREGRWTYEYKLNLMRQVSDDLNNDGVYDTNDRLGMLYADNSAANVYFASAKTYLFTRTEDSAEFTGDSERAYTLYETIQNILTDKSIAYDWSNIKENSSQVIINMIDQKQVLFLDIGLHFVRRNLRDLEADYSILPMPKLDEEQDNYYTMMNESMTHILIPASITQPEKVGFILEALAENSEDISETYYKTCIEGKYVRDTESVEMLNIASQNIIYDLGFINDFGGLGFALRQGIMDGTSYSSLIASYKTAAITAMETYFKK